MLCSVGKERFVRRAIERDILDVKRFGLFLVENGSHILDKQPQGIQVVLILV